MVTKSEFIAQRKQYCKPQLERVRLIPRESVLAACKGDGTNSDIGNAPPGCAGPTTSCLTDGSS